MGGVLVAVHRGLNRRVRGPEAPVERTKVFHIGKMVFDGRKQMLSGNGDDRSLTTKETHLLHVLCEHMNGTLERTEALRSVRGESNHFNSRSMDVYIAKLRKYLAEEPGVEDRERPRQGFPAVGAHSCGLSRSLHLPGTREFRIFTSLPSRMKNRLRHSVGFFHALPFAGHLHGCSPRLLHTRSGIGHLLRRFHHPLSIGGH